MSDICCCEFEPDPNDPDEDTIATSWHFRRTCPHCLGVWWSLHCRHDSIQRGCPQCGRASFWPAMAPSNDVAIEAARQAWRHWSRAVGRTFAVIPSLTLYASYRGAMIFVAGWFSLPVAPHLNDNEKQEVS